MIHFSKNIFKIETYPSPVGNLALRNVFNGDGEAIVNAGTGVDNTETTAAQLGPETVGVLQRVTADANRILRDFSSPLRGN